MCLLDRLQTAGLLFPLSRFVPRLAGRRASLAPHRVPTPRLVASAVSGGARGSASGGWAAAGPLPTVISRPLIQAPPPRSPSLRVGAVRSAGKAAGIALVPSGPARTSSPFGERRAPWDSSAPRSESHSPGLLVLRPAGKRPARPAGWEQKGRRGLSVFIIQKRSRRADSEVLGSVRAHQR